MQHVVLKTRLEWLKEHARETRSGWFCHESGVQIKYKEWKHPVWDVFFNQSGFGDMETLAYPYCPHCEPNFSPPEEKVPLYIKDLVIVGSPRPSP